MTKVLVILLVLNARAGKNWPASSLTNCKQMMVKVSIRDTGLTNEVISDMETINGYLVV